MLLIFLLKLEICWVTVQGIEQKISAFSEDFLHENDFEAVLATLCCYDYRVNASEAVQNIVIDQKDYHRSYLYVAVRCKAKAYHQ